MFLHVKVNRSVVSYVLSEIIGSLFVFFPTLFQNSFLGGKEVIT